MNQLNSSQNQRESKLNKSFDSLRKENYDSTFYETEAWLKSANTNLLNKKPERKFINMKNYFLANKFKLAYTFLILIVVIAACNYPVTQEETVADVLTWTVDQDNTDAISKIENMDWFKKGTYNYNVDNVNGKEVATYSFIVSKEDHNRIPDYQRQLQDIAGIMTVNITPVNETVKRPFYSALLNGIFKIDINATNMSDKELTDEVTSQLKKAGIENAQVSFEKNSVGHRMLKLTIPDQPFKSDGGFDMTIKDGENVNRIKQVRKNGPGDDRFKGKTDEEIRKMVKEDFPDVNLTDDQIEIIREGDKVRVQVKVSKVEGGEKGKFEIEKEIE